jgi:hypothetical protein
LLTHVLIPHALLSLKLGRAAAAATFVGAWERLERDYEVNFPEQGRMFFPDPAEIRAALGDDAYERAWAEGFTMDVDEMVALVVAAHDVA